jgi:hypothetical protein
MSAAERKWKGFTRTYPAIGEWSPVGFYAELGIAIYYEAALTICRASAMVETSTAVRRALLALRRDELQRLVDLYLERVPARRFYTGG